MCGHNKSIKFNVRTVSIMILIKVVDLILNLQMQ